MTRLYSDDDLYNAYMQRRKLLAGFFIATGLWLAVLIGFIVYYTFLPYGDPNATWVKAVTSIWTALYLIFLFPYMGISFKRCNAYCKMLKFISRGIKEYNVAPFEGIEDWTTHDGVDVNVACFSVPNVKRDGMMTRQVYVDGEKYFPPFEEGKRVRFVTQGNLLIEYEIEENNNEEKE